MEQYVKIERGEFENILNRQLLLIDAINGLSKRMKYLEDTRGKACADRKSRIFSLMPRSNIAEDNSL